VSGMYVYVCMYFWVTKVQNIEILNGCPVKFGKPQILHYFAIIRISSGYEREHGFIESYNSMKPCSLCSVTAHLIN
jgi:hypothetical protein